MSYFKRINWTLIINFIVATSGLFSSALTITAYYKQENILISGVLAPVACVCIYGFYWAFRHYRECVERLNELHTITEEMRSLKSSFFCQVCTSITKSTQCNLCCIEVAEGTIKKCLITMAKVFLGKDCKVKLWLTTSNGNFYYVSDNEDLRIKKNNIELSLLLFNSFVLTDDDYYNSVPEIIVVKAGKIIKAPDKVIKSQKDLKHLEAELTENKNKNMIALPIRCGIDDSNIKTLGFLQISSKRKHFIDLYFNSLYTVDFWGTICDQFSDIIYRYIVLKEEK